MAFPGPSQDIISDSKVWDSGGAPMAAGAWVTPPDDSWRPEHTIAANDSSRVGDTLRAQLATVGLNFQIEPNPHTEEEMAALQA